MKCSVKKCENSVSELPRDYVFFDHTIDELVRSTTPLDKPRFKKLCNFHIELRREENKVLRKQKYLITKGETKNTKKIQHLTPGQIYNKSRKISYKESDVTKCSDDCCRVHKFYRSRKQQRDYFECKPLWYFEDETTNTVMENMKKNAELQYQEIWNKFLNDIYMGTFDVEIIEENDFMKGMKYYINDAVERIYDLKRIWQDFFDIAFEKITEVPYYNDNDGKYITLKKNMYASGDFISIAIDYKILPVKFFKLDFVNFQWARLGDVYQLYVKCILRIFSFFVKDMEVFREDLLVPANVFVRFHIQKGTFDKTQFLQEFNIYMYLSSQQILLKFYPSDYPNYRMWIENYNEFYWGLAMFSPGWNVDHFKRMDENSRDDYILKLELFKDHPEIHKYFPKHFVTKFITFLEKIQLKQNEMICD